MEIEQFKINDEVVEAFNKGFSDYVVKLPLLNEENFAEKMIHSNNSNIRYSSVCRDNGKIAGIILAGNEGSTTMINAMCVLPEYRGSGAAMLLMDETTRLARKGVLELEVFEGNSRAIGFYKKYGFKLTDEINYMAGKIPEWEYCIAGEIKDISYNELIVLQNLLDIPLIWQSRIHCILNQNIFAKGYYINENLLGFIVYIENITVSIKQLYVLEQARKSGIGYKLLRSAVKDKLCSCIFIDNPDGKGFFRSLHFTEKMHLLRMKFDL